jgi:hypothetical protein
MRRLGLYSMLGGRGCHGLSLLRHHCRIRPPPNSAPAHSGGAAPKYSQPSQKRRRDLPDAGKHRQERDDLADCRQCHDKARKRDEKVPSADKANKRSV